MAVLERLRVLFLFVPLLAVTAADAAPWRDPPILLVPPSAVISLDAFTDWVDVPGLGRVGGASFFDFRRGGEERSVPARRSLMPPVLQVDRGSAFELRLHNRLTTIAAADLGKPRPPRMPDPTNVHTHGLIVAPTGTGFGGRERPELGDCVLPMAASQAGTAHHEEGHAGHAGGLAQDPCATDTPPGMAVADRLDYAYVIAADHPGGLFWIHPHPHGQSEIQLSNGASGMMAIGSIWESLFFKCRLTASPTDGSGACMTQDAQREERRLEVEARGTTGRPGLLRTRYLGLKDVQVAQLPGPLSRPSFDLIPFPHRPAPDHPDPAFGPANDARKSICGNLPRPDGDGEVIPPGPAPTRGACWGKDGASRNVGWAFTVSGQLYPRIEVAPGSTELWRIANMSADVSYRLQLKGADGTLYRMRPVAIDGVPISIPALDPTAAQPSRSSTSGTAIPEIVLMPSARIEVLLERCPAGPATDTGCVPPDREVAAVLRTRGMATGMDDKGDLWPAIDLAEVVFKPSLGRGAPMLPAREAALPKLAVAAARAAPAPAPAAVAPAASAAAPADACDYQHGPDRFPLGGTRVRLIRLKNNSFGENEAFGIHDQLFDLETLADGKPITLAALFDEGAAKSGGPPLIRGAKLPQPCSDISTLDGFKQYYVPFDPGHDNVTAKYGTEEYWLVVNDSLECHNFHIHQMKFSVVDADFQGTEAAEAGGPLPRSDQCAGDRTAIRPINQAALLDNYPLPSSARVLFRLRFDGPKLGRFVFHCHILEHEDKGMMALLRVVE